MTKLEEAKQILADLYVPKKQQSDLCCYTLLAMAGIKANDTWSDTSNKWIRIHDILVFLKTNYNIFYAENSRETIRKQAIHHFRNAAFIEDNGKATNSPNYRYRLTNEIVALLQSYEHDWHHNKENFLQIHEKLIDMYDVKRTVKNIPVKINNTNFNFSVGKHNQLQKAIFEKFMPYFAPSCECLYVGDTTKKDLVKNESLLQKLGFNISVHDKMPDVILYDEEKNWLYFIEAVTSVGPMEPKRIKEIKEMTAKVSAGKIFITAFLDFKTFKRFSDTIAWDTEVWIAEFPEHMIHMNGDKFIGPR